MGTLRFFNLQPLLEQFGCRVLFETGTGLGDAVKYASYFRLDRLISVEIHPALAAEARAEVGRDPRADQFLLAKRRCGRSCRRSRSRRRSCSGSTRTSRRRLCASASTPARRVNALRCNASWR